jgi:hypothetical protein
MTAIAIRPDVAPPPDATKIFDWDYVLNDHELHRTFHGTQRGPVKIDGFQNPDGSIHSRGFYIDMDALERQELDAAAARKLARALIATADELDELAG